MPDVVGLDDFKKNLKKYAKRTVPKIVKDAQVVVAMYIYKAILETTPVLTSKARRNWFVTFNGPSDETIEETAGIKVTGAPMNAVEKSRAYQVLRNIHFGTGSAFVPIFIANNLPYIKGLDDGRSAKAPAGIVSVALAKAFTDTASLEKEIRAKVKVASG